MYLIVDKPTGCELGYRITPSFDSSQPAPPSGHFFYGDTMLEVELEWYVVKHDAEDKIKTNLWQYSAYIEHYLRVNEVIRNEDLGYTLRARKDELVSLECGSHREVWDRSPHYAGYAILIDGVSYEFVSSHYENSDF